mmetsp:Transcript_101754/g.286965  ORF Transcript_101754/g.286965 Transcript_101754/m.286965 type:complete len:362 (-) Transcript_101754:332-1417(-)
MDAAPEIVRVGLEDHFLLRAELNSRNLLRVALHGTDQRVVGRLELTTAHQRGRQIVPNDRVLGVDPRAGLEGQAGPCVVAQEKMRIAERVEEVAALGSGAPKVLLQDGDTLSMPFGAYQREAAICDKTPMFRPPKHRHLCRARAVHGLGQQVEGAREPVFRRGAVVMSEPLQAAIPHVSQGFEWTRRRRYWCRRRSLRQGSLRGRRAQRDQREGEDRPRENKRHMQEWNRSRRLRNCPGEGRHGDRSVRLSGALIAPGRRRGGRGVRSATARVRTPPLGRLRGGGVVVNVVNFVDVADANRISALENRLKNLVPVEELGVLLRDPLGLRELGLEEAHDAVLLLLPAQGELPASAVQRAGCS